MQPTDTTKRQPKHAPEIETMTSLTASRDAAQVQAVIRERYGFEATLQYCAALVDFVEALTDGQ